MLERMQVRCVAPHMRDRLVSKEVVPATYQPVIRHMHSSRVRELLLMRWGMVPFFAMNTEAFRGISTCNVQAESVLPYQIWNKPFQSGRRCLIPASGFYEWVVQRQRVERGHGLPYAFSLHDQVPLAFAGLWDAWQSRHTGQWLQSFTIITTVANRLVSQVHPRMPAVLQPSEYEEWLSEDSSPFHLLRPFPVDQMKMDIVRKKLRRTANYPVELLNSS